MSSDQNENQNTGGTIKPIIHKTNLRLHRPQTTGYEQEEVPEANLSTQSKPTPPSTAKPSLNISASVYIPKSFSSSSSSGNVTAATQDKTTQPANQPSSNVQSNMMNANAQAFTQKINTAYNANMNAPINPMAQNYNMSQMNANYPGMYNMQNMGMINSNSMMNYTYLNQNYQNYHPQAQQGYNAYMHTTPTNKFSSNQFYSPQTPNPTQMYNNVYQNKIQNQMPMNVPAQTIPIATPPIANNIVSNTNLSAQASPSISTLSHSNLPLQKDLNISSVSTSSTTSHIKKPINLEAQSFIPKNLKKPSITSEKDLQGLTPKKESLDKHVETINETPEKKMKQTEKKEITTNKNISEKNVTSPIIEIQQQKTPITKKDEENERQKTPIKENEDDQSPDNFLLDKRDAVVPTEEKYAPQANENVNIEATKQKPKTLLGSILSQPPASIAQSKPVEKTTINAVPVAAPSKKKQNDLSKAFEEKAKVLKEQERLKKEEKLREETKQKQSSVTSTPTSARKSGKDLSKKAEKKKERIEDAEEKEFEKEKVRETDKEKIIEDERKTIEEFKEKEEKEKEGPIKLEEKAERKFKIERIYFRVFEDEKAEDIKNRYAYEYLFSYRNLKISYETKLVEDLMTGHFKALKETLEEVSTNRQQSRGATDTKGGFGKRGTKFRDEPVQPKIANENVTFQRSKIEFKQPEAKESPTAESGEGLGKWGRKDLSKEEKLATEFKTKREEEIKKDPIRFKLTEHLNTITIDNFAETKQAIMDLINQGQENQEKFIEALFKKAVTEKSYVVIYARLCKEVDRELSPKEENLKGTITPKKQPAKTSTFRTKLLEKCKNVFKNEDQEELSLYVNIKDPEERQQRQKAFLLGNVNFIAEMIINKILSKKVVNQCINNLFARVEKLEKENDFVKQVCLEGIVILTDKLGTLVNRLDTKIKAEDQQKFNEDIDGYFDRLNEIQENDKTLPGHIRFKIINLIEKKNKNWEESIVESNRKIKGKDEVREEHEMDQRGGIPSKSAKGNVKLDQDTINIKIKDEMSNWKEYKKLGKNRNFEWSITESILGNKSNTISEIISAFGENCIDFIGKFEDIDIAYTYLYEILDFYHKNIGEKDKKEIKNTILFFLSNLSDLILDNGLLIDLWESVLHAFLEFEIFGFNELDELKENYINKLKKI